MTFYQKIESLCKKRGITVTTLAANLGFSSSAGTTWKKSKGLPRNSTLKKIADYFEISVEELETGVSVAINYDTDTLTAPEVASDSSDEEKELIGIFELLGEKQRSMLFKYANELVKKKPLLIVDDETRFLVRRAGRDGSYTEEFLTKAEIKKIEEETQSLPEADF